MGGETDRRTERETGELPGESTVGSLEVTWLGKANKGNRVIFLAPNTGRHIVSVNQYTDTGFYRGQLQYGLGGPLGPGLQQARSEPENHSSIDYPNYPSI